MAIPDGSVLHETVNEKYQVDRSYRPGDLPTNPCLLETIEPQAANGMAALRVELETLCHEARKSSFLGCEFDLVSNLTCSSKHLSVRRPVVRMRRLQVRPAVDLVDSPVNRGGEVPLNCRLYSERLRGSETRF